MKFFNYLKLKFFLFLVFFATTINAGEKDKIILNLKNTNSIKFNFTQFSNEKKEAGLCLLLFPEKLKCKYKDNMHKELIISEKKLVIIQKRYDKKYFYPISKSPFLKVLNKKDLIKIIKEANIEINGNRIELVGSNTESYKKINILFNKKNFDLAGWKIIDQYNNKIIFNIDIVSKNLIFDKNEFKLPNLN